LTFMKKYFLPIIIVFTLIASPAICVGFQKGQKAEDPADRAKAALGIFATYRSNGEENCLMRALAMTDDTAMNADPAAGPYPAMAEFEAYQATGDRYRLESARRLAAALPKTGPDAYLADTATLLQGLFIATGDKKYGSKPAADVYDFLVIGGLDNPATRGMIKAAYTIGEQDRVVIVLDPARDKDRVDELGYEYPDKPVTYVCSEKTCFPPAYTPEGVTKTRELIKKFREASGGK